MVSNAARYIKVVDKLKEHVEVHFCDQATVAEWAMKDLPVFTKTNMMSRQLGQNPSGIPASRSTTNLSSGIENTRIW